jgi:hypothetical protein
MIPDFPIDKRIRFAEQNFFLLLPDFANFAETANRAEN